MVKTTQQRTEALRKRRVLAGEVERHEHLYHKDDYQKVVNFVIKLNKERVATTL